MTEAVKSAPAQPDIASTAPDLITPWRNYRANLYALKDLGVRCVLGFGAAGAISHNYNVGDIVLVSDLIDRTTRRPTTFFENAPTGMLRQFPVFCPGLRRAMADCLDGMGCGFHQNSTLVVTEGPRLETPAEIRFLATAGAELVSHHFAPEAFLAKELELCYAGAAYVANYAETGSRYRPFSATDLFGGLAVRNEVERLNRATEMVANLVVLVSQRVLNHSAQCECNQTMRGQVEKFGLSTDWRDWFGPADSAGKGRYNTIPRRTDDLPVHVSKRI